MIDLGTVDLSFIAVRVIHRLVGSSIHLCSGCGKSYLYLEWEEIIPHDQIEMQVRKIGCVVYGPML